MDVPDIVEKLDEQTARRIKAYPHPNNRASEAGHPCVRFLVLSRLESDKKTLHDVGLQRIFDEGNLHEDALVREIQGAGFKLVEQQRAFEWKDIQLSGRIDALISVNGSFVPLEIKSCSPNVFPSIKETTPEDMVNSRYSWVRKYPAQILLYMLMGGHDTGIMIFKNKTTGEKCQKVFRLTDANLAYAEAVIKKLEAVNGYVGRREVPPLERCDECRGCGFSKTICFPGQDYGPGIEILTDAELEEKLIRRAELESASREFEQIDKEVKEQLKGRSAVIGSFLVESKECQRKNYDIPADVKKQFESVSTYWRTTIERI